MSFGNCVNSHNAVNTYCGSRVVLIAMCRQFCSD